MAEDEGKIFFDGLPRAGGGDFQILARIRKECPEREAPIFGFVERGKKTNFYKRNYVLLPEISRLAFCDL